MGLKHDVQRRLKEAGKAAIDVPKNSAVGFWKGVTYPFRGLKFIFVDHFTLVRFWIFPILITILAMGAVIWAGVAWTDDVVGWFWSPPTDEGFWGALARFFYVVVEILVAVLIWVGGILAVVFLTNVIAAPFNDLLSEEVERLATGKEGNPFSWRALVRDTFRSLWLELAKVLMYAAVMVPLGIASHFLPVIGHALYAVFGFVFTAMYFAMDYIDWPASRRNRGVVWRFGLLAERFMPMFGFGTGVWLFLFVPLVNLLFMPAAVAGGTLLFLDLEREREALNALVPGRPIEPFESPHATST